MKQSVFSTPLASYAEALLMSLGVAGAAVTALAESTFKGGAPTVSVLRVFYTALPCALALLPASLYASHPINWPDSGTLTDWQVETSGKRVETSRNERDGPKTTRMTRRRVIMNCYKWPVIACGVFHLGGMRRRAD
ncbi:Uncharacterized protein SCF082_LOCUS4323 [Durusdinium trenchii]|uniref:EamA domain-containing protein n=1 Tax=Durusdinium trenchii TaxID=1381693 RepID=A0ABP0HYQ4_9DINO